MLKKIQKNKGMLSIALLSLILTACEYGPENDQNTLRPKGPAAKMILDLFTGVMVVATIIGVGVLSAIIFVIIKFRRRSDDDSPKQIHGSTVVEIIWTLIPFIILVCVAVPSMSVLWNLHETPKNPINVTVVGKQWWWQFETKTNDYKITNAAGEVKTSNVVVGANELVIPVNRNISLKVRACDGNIPEATDAKEVAKANPCNVIHSFWIPSLNGKVDAVPGRTNRLTLRADKIGVYTGQCAEFCGLGHSTMRMRVKVVSQEEYDKWITQQQTQSVVPFLDAQQKPAGEAQQLIQNFGCTNCHTFNDPSAVSYGPNLTHAGSRSVIGSGIYQNDFEHMWKWIYNSTDLDSGIPMQSENCRAPADVEDRRCVGMPDFSKDYEYTDPVSGQKVKLKAMSKSEAKIIAKYLLENK